MLNKNNISFICIKEEFDTSRPMGKAMMYIASVFSQLERETTAERVKDNMLMLARTGRWLGGTPPTGYRSEKVQESSHDGKIRTHCRLVSVREELSKVKEIYRIFLSCKSIKDTGEILKIRGIMSKNGNTFSSVVIKQILTNPVYCIADTSARRYFDERNSNICFDEKDCSPLLGLAVYNKRDYTRKKRPETLRKRLDNRYRRTRWHNKRKRLDSGTEDHFLLTMLQEQETITRVDTITNLIHCLFQADTPPCRTPFPQAPCCVLLPQVQAHALLIYSVSAPISEPV